MELRPPGTDEVDRPAQGGWLFPALLATVLLVSAVIALNRSSPDEPALGREDSAWAPSERPLGETVGLEIDFGNGARKAFDALPWREGMTVADLMLTARDFRPGIDFTQQGQGASGFLTAIDGLENQGAEGRNWRYEVNGQHGDVSFCLQELSSGMRVLWEFATEE
jgi:hypothetical protein